MVCNIDDSPSAAKLANASLVANESSVLTDPIRDTRRSNSRLFAITAWIDHDHHLQLLHALCKVESTLLLAQCGYNGIPLFSSS